MRATSSPISCPKECDPSKFGFDKKKKICAETRFTFCPNQVRNKCSSNFTHRIRGGWEIPLEAQNKLRPNSGLFLSKHLERNQSDDAVEEPSGLSPRTEARLMKTQGLVQMNHCQSFPESICWWQPNKG